MGSENYDEELVKVIIERITEEKEREREREEKEKEREERERERERNFELEKLRINSSSNTSEIVHPSQAHRHRGKVDINNVMAKFDCKENDISLYLTLFERQAKRYELDVREWVSSLIGLMPYEINVLIAREPEELADDYQHVKQLLLDKFKLSPEKFRQLFVKHQRTEGVSWKEFSYINQLPPRMGYRA